MWWLGQNFQALVEFSSVEAASQARAQLDGKDLFQGCCHLSVNFSNRGTLTVKENNAKSRDYTLDGGAGLPNGLPPQFAQHPQHFANYGAPPPHAPYGAPHMQQYGAPPNPYGAPFGNNSPFAPPNFGPAGGHGWDQSAPPAPAGSSPVVLVNKLSETKDPNSHLDQLFTLFGVYGDVLRVKILFGKHDTAMVQFRTAQQAQLAVHNLNGAVLNGQPIQVTPSRHPEVKLPMPPRAGAEQEQGANLTRDFSNSPNHRFKGQGVINLKNVNAPSQVLHVANIPEGTSTAQLGALFAQVQGGAPVVVEFFKKDRKMAYVGLNSVPDAVTALLQLHNYQLGTHHLRVSFSHKDPTSLSSDDAAPTQQAQ
jgi:hnRNP-L/PTB/hephaestus splicing factor